MKNKKGGIVTHGHPWHEELPHSMDNKCPGCADETMIPSPGFIGVFEKHVKGIDTGCSKGPRIIFQCPKCLSLFWFHLHVDTAKLLFVNNTMD